MSDLGEDKMRTQSLSQSETLEGFIIPQISNDVSHLAALWFFSDGLSLPEAKEFVLTAIYPGHFDISVGGLEDHGPGRAASDWQEAISYRPRTPLGQRLLEMRSRIVSSGEILMGWKEIEEEVAARRGETE
jgi:hypothetical protein